MKKLVLGLGLLLVLWGGFVVNSYYQDVYVGQDYYVKVPLDQARTLEKWKSGKYTITGRRYEFVGVNKEGQERVLNISITDDNGSVSESDLLQGGQYLVVSASNKRVINYRVIDQDQVPQGILEILG